MEMQFPILLFYRIRIFLFMIIILENKTQQKISNEEKIK
jgi:hypothetical protein